MESEFETKILICGDCEEEFVFTIAAQVYFAEKGYTEDPKLCKACYMHRKRDKRFHGRVGSDVADAYAQQND